MRRVLPVLFLFLFAAALVAAPPTAIAIRDARIVTVSGAVLERGTIIVRDGLIESVGAGIAVPADAWIVEGKGLTIYPGLIDALSTLGLPEYAPQEPAAGSRRGGPPGTPSTPATPSPVPTPAQQTQQQPARGPEDRPSNTSWIKAADVLSATDRRIETARNLGFTTAVSFPARNLFAGQGAVINLAGDKPGQMVVASPAGMYLTITRGFGMGEFPSSLFGILAYFRQIAIDAEHYKAEKACYAKHPTGHKRPAYDRALEGYLEAPRLLLPAQTAVEIDRMVHFVPDLKAPVVLYGAFGAYREAGLLKKSGLPVLVSLKWPERERDTDPEQVDSLRTLEYRDKAPSTPAALAKAGVKFALYTENLAERDLRRNVKRALDAGLSHADLVRAMTLSAAEIYGVSDRLGSIDAGKIANLVVTDGDLFAEKTKVKYIFVDGRKFEPMPEAPPAQARTEEAQ